MTLRGRVVVCAKFEAAQEQVDVRPSLELITVAREWREAETLTEEGALSGGEGEVGGIVTTARGSGVVGGLGAGGGGAGV